jgi:mRNA-degrading endonuclease toxin of MazEF toxin-antitoxin module
MLGISRGDKPLSQHEQLEPVQGSETGKTRPCVIVTNNVYNQRVPVIQIVPITEWSEKKAKIKTNVEHRLYNGQIFWSHPIRIEIQFEI